MAKKASPKARSKKPKDAPVERGIADVQAFHRIGKASRRKRPERAEYGGRVIEEEAERTGLNPDTMRKARQFADEDEGYSADELDRLFELARKHGFVLGRSFIIRMLSVPKQSRKRTSLGRDAIKNG